MGQLRRDSPFERPRLNPFLLWKKLKENLLQVFEAQEILLQK